MVGQPGFEPGSRDPQPRSIDQANLQALLFMGVLWVESTNVSVYSVFTCNTERSYFINQINMSNEHSAAAISLDS